MGSLMKMTWMIVLLALVGTPMFAFADTSEPMQAVFTSVTGKVQVKTKKGHKTKTAKKDLTVFEGDRIIASGNDSKATLRLFDGSSIDVSPKTEFVLSKLQKPSDQDKVIKFRLIVGKLLAAVEKLTTSKSSFEIEAGGVVCGVRGTKFTMECDGKPKPQVELHVFEGVVYSIDAKGNKYFFHPGPPIKFVNSTITDSGKQQGSTKPPANNNNNGNNNNSGNSTTGLQDLGQQFNNNVHLNGNKDLGTAQNNVITIKPVVGN